MRKVIFGGANSLDNYLARKDGATDRILWSDEASAVIDDYWQRIDDVVMGRKTYEFGLPLGYWDAERPGVKTYVFSRTLQEGAVGNVTIISMDAGDFVRALKNQDGKEICVMGGR